MTQQTSRRRVFVRGRIQARPTPKPCAQDVHAGPLLDAERFNRFAAEHAGDPLNVAWLGMGICRACGSTVHHSQIRRAS